MAYAVRQSTANAWTGSPYIPSLTWGEQPAEGSLMVAVVMAYASGNAFQPANGWQLAPSMGSTQGAQAGNSDYSTGVYWKYAGSDEPTTVEIDAGAYGAGWSLTAWEVTGASGHFWKDVVRVQLFYTNGGPAESVSPASFTSQTTTDLVLIGVLNRPAEGVGEDQTFSWSSGWTGDGSYVSPDNSDSGYCWGAGAHMAVSGAETIDPTLTFGVSTYWVLSYIELGVSVTPNLDAIPVPAQTGGDVAEDGSLSVTFDLTTFGTDDAVIVLIGVAYEGDATPAPSASASSLTFRQRAMGTPIGTYTYAWWSLYAPADDVLTAEEISVAVDFSGTPGESSLVVIGMGIGGCPDPADPWDTNPNWPIISTDAENSWVTTLDDCFVLAMSFYDGPTDEFPEGAAWLPIMAAQYNSAPAPIANIASAWAPQPTAGDGSTGWSDGNGFYIEATTAVSPPPPPPPPPPPIPPGYLRVQITGWD